MAWPWRRDTARSTEELLPVTTVLLQCLSNLETEAGLTTRIFASAMASKSLILEVCVDSVQSAVRLVLLLAYQWGFEILN
jgi:hypothetical protein